MALSPLAPFTEHEFARRVAPFLDWIHHHVEGTVIAGRRGYLSHLHSYCWQGDDWKMGVKKRCAMSDELRKADSALHLLKAANNILTWGGITKELSLTQITEIRSSFSILDGLAQRGTGRWKAIFGNRLASVSKVYEMHDLKSWTIYDSRVATGLALLVQSWWEHLGKEKLDDLLRFPCPPSRRSGWEPPAGFPRLGSSGQARLAFIYRAGYARPWQVASTRASALRYQTLDGTPITWR